MTQTHKVVSPQEWLEARTALLAEEKEFTRLRDRLSQKRRELPWMKVDKEYVFEGADGRRSLAELFEGRSQLIVYHFMFGPDDKAGCPHCSHWADSFNGVIVHLNARDVSMVAVSRAPQSRLAAYRKRMGWSFQWYSSNGSDFNFDYRISFTPEQLQQEKTPYNFGQLDPGCSEREGISVFFKDAGGAVYRTYSTYARGIDMMSADYHYLDLTPKGRDENGQGPYWVRRRDEYGS